ncbi:ribonuclease P protein component [Sporomusa termitida]|uniref:Ribonuclease P protein component n=1 Tax=Sporomusa termitida TaxID=2377 RepID=A0A517E0G3_9FIRM|nr:ribonuclease P protein component [Sporomusa termitida]QDR83095.1 Ribonuclease P protein component [Sporomusa termitida]
MVKRFTLPKCGRLCQTKSFQAVYRSGKSYTNKLLVLYVLPNRSGKRRIGFAAGKRLGPAVVRNRLKRLLREAYRLHQGEILNGVDLVLVARQPLVKAGQAQTTKAFLEICSKAKLMAEKL